MFDFFIGFFKCLAGAHQWDEGEPFDCLCGCDATEGCAARECKRCGYRQTKINGIWGDDHDTPCSDAKNPK